eukprot:CAMPEP_0116890190 /NCGR_PEP_ID=MMETSP0467-20121206/726_1 /TAXON_ID=283647 /ORGANISM="Mesodinium pulex, Strain SPMC105" /LENGTH=76 /DNA_ID=CAMNT_0004557697 /DNA_START=1282 /DNA_END=1512 /DNA_ORIENTATION=-
MNSINGEEDLGSDSVDGDFDFKHFKNSTSSEADSDADADADSDITSLPMDTGNQIKTQIKDPTINTSLDQNLLLES